MSQVIVKRFLSDSVSLKNKILEDDSFLRIWEQGAKMLAECGKKGGTIYICGNGGSACDAMHFREELVARYKRERPGIRAQHFIDGPTTTCWANDYEYAGGFEREAETFLESRDVLVGISTSGNSKNVIRAVQSARGKGAKTIGLLGKDGGELKELVDCALVVPSSETDRIQEVHITLIHAFCEYLERLNDSPAE